MTDKNDESQHDKNSHELDKTLYSADKANRSTPRSVRRNVMLAAKKEELAFNALPNQIKNWANTTKSLLASSALVALVAVVWVGQYKLEQGGFDEGQYTNVQIHSLSSGESLASENIRLKYDEAYREFLQQQGTLSAHHQSSAKLQMSNEGWTLATCENELLQISDELLAVLNDVKRVDIDLAVGDSVDILFAMDGRIIQILKSPVPLRC